MSVSIRSLRAEPGFETGAIGLPRHDRRGGALQPSPAPAPLMGAAVARSALEGAMGETRELDDTLMITRLAEQARRDTTEFLRGLASSGRPPLDRRERVMDWLLENRRLGATLIEASKAFVSDRARLEPASWIRCQFMSLTDAPEVSKVDVEESAKLRRIAFDVLLLANPEGLISIVAYGLALRSRFIELHLGLIDPAIISPDLLVLSQTLRAAMEGVAEMLGDQGHLSGSFARDAGVHGQCGTFIECVAETHAVAALDTPKGPKRVLATLAAAALDFVFNGPVVDELRSRTMEAARSSFHEIGQDKAWRWLTARLACSTVRPEDCGRLERIAGRVSQEASSDRGVCAPKGEVADPPHPPHSHQPELKEPMVDRSTLMKALGVSKRTIGSYRWLEPAMAKVGHKFEYDLFLVMKLARAQNPPREFKRQILPAGILQKLEKREEELKPEHTEPDREPFDRSPVIRRRSERVTAAKFEEHRSNTANI